MVVAVRLHIGGLVLADLAHMLDDERREVGCDIALAPHQRDLEIFFELERERLVPAVERRTRPSHRLASVVRIGIGDGIEFFRRRARLALAADVGRRHALARSERGALADISAQRKQSESEHRDACDRDQDERHLERRDLFFVDRLQHDNGDDDEHYRDRERDDDCRALVFLAFLSHCPGL